jgi:hypothetical protein
MRKKKTTGDETGGLFYSGGKKPLASTLSGDAGEEKRKDQKGLYESHTEKHWNEDLTVSAGVAGDAVNGGAYDAALAQGAAKSGNANGEAFSDRVVGASSGRFVSGFFSHRDSGQEESGGANSQ